MYSSQDEFDSPQNQFNSFLNRPGIPGGSIL